MTQQRLAVRTTILCVLGAVACALTACHTSRSAPADRGPPGALPAPEAWPERDVSFVRPFADRTPEEVFYWEPDGTIPLEQIAPHNAQALATPERRVLRKRIVAGGLLRVWEDTQPKPWSLGFGDRFRQNATFLTERDATGYSLETAIKDVPDQLGVPRGATNFMRPGLQRTFQGTAALLDRGVGLHIPSTPGSRGTLVVLGGLMTNRWQESVIDRLNDQGWAVVQVDPVTSVRAPNDDDYRRVLDRQSKWAIDRFVERQAEVDATHDAQQEAAAGDHRQPANSARARRDSARSDSELMLDDLRTAREMFPTPPTGFELLPDTDPVELGRLIATGVDDLLAENAYAASAAIDDMVRTHGRDALGPIVIIGFSGGSLGSPAVAARLLADGIGVDAMILIGAGANLFSISQTSTASDGGIRLAPRELGRPRPTLPADRLAEVERAYLNAVRLDAYAVAPALRDVPTLLVLASNDKAVPNADVLDERLGFPERITYHGGHRGLFYFLPGKTSSMVRWLDRVVPRD